MSHESSDSESSSGGMDLLDGVAEGDVQSLMDCEKELKQNPHLYDTHIHYIAVLRGAGLKEKLRRARQEFQQRFPLSEKLWLEWIEDETDGETQEELLTLAVQDYLSLALWKRRLHLTRDPVLHDASVEKLEKWRRVSTEALEIAGVHFSQGHEIWMEILDGEKKILALLPTEETEDQVERIRQLYFDALQMPLLHADVILDSYRQWEQERGSMTTEPPPHVQSLMKSAAEAIDARQKCEKALSVEDVTEKLAAYVSYSAMEERHGSVRQVECIYERAIVDFPVTHSLWLQYGSYIEKKTKCYEKIQELYTRATRNCPWLGSLWERRIRAAALYEKEAPEAQKIYEGALQAGLQTEEDYMVVLLAWLDFLRCDYWRQKKASDEEVSFAPLAAAFAFASSLMKSYFPKYLDRQHRIGRYWTESLISITNDIDQARSVWEDLLQDPQVASAAETWMYYIRMEVSEKHHGPARKLYSRAFHAITDSAARYALVIEWLRHEGTVQIMSDDGGVTLLVLGMTGTPRQYANAVQSTQTFLQDYTASVAAQQHPSLASAAQKKAKKATKLTTTDVTQLRRLQAKVHKDEHARNKIQVDDAGQKEEGHREFYDDKNTLYVSRIALGTEDSQLREIFQDCGDITALRHMRFFNGDSRGHAYIVFSDEAGMKAGLEKSHTLLNGKKILVQISCPTRLHRGIPHPREQRTRGRGRSRGRGRGALLPKEGESLTNDDFRKMLE